MLLKKADRRYEGKLQLNRRSCIRTQTGNILCFQTSAKLIKISAVQLIIGSKHEKITSFKSKALRMCIVSAVSVRITNTTSSQPFSTSHLNEMKLFVSEVVAFASINCVRLTAAVDERWTRPRSPPTAGWHGFARAKGNDAQSNSMIQANNAAVGGLKPVCRRIYRRAKKPATVSVLTVTCSKRETTQ